MEIADLHTHTRLCRHAEGSPEEYLAAALARGERYYGIADHCPFPSGFEPDWRMAESEFPEYRRIVGEMKRKAAGSGLSVLYGIEMDYVPGRRAEIEAKLAPEKMDYVIGSIHCVDGFCFDDPASLSVWESPGMAERIWKGYLRDLKIFVSEWNFQILGHPDLPKKFGYCAERTEDFFRSLAIPRAVVAGIVEGFDSVDYDVGSDEACPGGGAFGDVRFGCARAVDDRAELCGGASVGEGSGI